MRRKFFALALCALICLGPEAFAGKDRGGGSDIGLHFAALAGEAITELDRSGLKDATAERLQKMKDALSRVQVISVDDDLWVPAGARLQNSVAVNDPENSTIEINRNRWLALANDGVRKALAVHELLGILGEEKTGIYHLSADYLIYLGSSQTLDEALKENLSWPSDNANPYRRFNCHVRSELIDLKTNRLAPMSKTDMEKNGDTLIWRDDGKRYILTHFTTRQSPLGKTQNSTFIQDFVTTHAGAKPSQLEETTVRRIGSTRMTFTVSYSYRGNDRYVRVGVNPENGSVEEQQVLDRNLDSNTEILAASRSGLNYTLNNFRLISQAETCIYSSLGNEGVAGFFKGNAAVRQRLDTFIEAHGQVKERKKAWLGCLATKADAACDSLKVSYLAADKDRDQLWANLFGKP